MSMEAFPLPASGGYLVVAPHSSYRVGALPIGAGLYPEPSLQQVLSEDSMNE